MQRTIHFRSIEWFGHHENTVECIKAVLAPRQIIDLTAFKIGLETVEVRHRDVSQQGAIFLHLNTYITGAKRGAAPHANVAASGDLIECTAPPNSEFSERETAVVVRGSQVGYISIGVVRSQFIEKAVRGLLNLEYTDELSRRFHLSAKANPEKIAELMNEGVNYLDLGLSLPHVDAAQHIDDQPDTLVGALGRGVKNAISARLMEDHQEHAIDSLAQANARLILSFKKRAPLDQIESLTALAKEAVEDDDEFKLRTREGTTFSRDSLLITGTYQQPGPSNVLNYVLAWQAISSFLDEQ